MIGITKTRKRYLLIGLALVVLAVGLLVVQGKPRHRPLQTPPKVSWKSKLWHPSDEVVSPICSVAPDGSIYIVDQYGTQYGMHGRRMDSNGHIFWNKILRPNPYKDNFYAIPGHDGKLYIYSPEDNSVAELLPNGEIATRRFLQGNTQNSIVVVDKKGCIYAISHISKGFRIQKFDRQGKKLWAVNKAVPNRVKNYTSSCGCEIDRKGNAFLIGNIADTDPRNARRNGFISKISLGGQSERFDLNSILPRNIMLDKNGNMVVVGTIHYQSPDDFKSVAGGSILERIKRSIDNWSIKKHRRVSGDSDCFITKLDSDGNEIWARQEITKVADEVHCACMDGKGNVYIACSSLTIIKGHSPISHLFVRKYNQNGDLLWRSKDIKIDCFESPASIDSDGSGSIYVCVVTQPMNSYSYLIKLQEQP